MYALAAQFQLGSKGKDQQQGSSHSCTQKTIVRLVSMSSAVPIHPMLRLARRTLLSSSPLGGAPAATSSGRYHLTPPNSRPISSTRSSSARPSKKAAAGASSSGGGRSSSSKGNSGLSAAPAAAATASSASGKGTTTTAAPSSSSSSSSSSSPSTSSANKYYGDRISLESIAAGSNKGQPSSQTASSPSPPVKLTDKRSPQAQKEAQQVEELNSKNPIGPIVDGKEQVGKGKVDPSQEEASRESKMPKGASMHPAAVEKDRKVSAAAAKESDQPRVDSIVEGIASTSTTDEQASKLTEGIVIRHYEAHNSNSGSSSGASANPETSSTSSSMNKGSGNPPDPPPPRSSAERMSEDGGSGPPAMTQGEKGKETPSPSSETSLSSIKRHDPAEAIMEATRHLIVSRGKRVIDHHISKTEVDNQAYLFTAALSELRTELQVRARNDAAALRSMVTLLQREVDGLNQKMREDVAGLKHDIQVDMNNRKGEAKEEQNTLEQEIQDLNNRFTISISDLKTEIEQNIKWDATRRALTVVFGCVVILIATLTAADHLTREEVDEDTVAQTQKRANQAPRAASEAVAPTRTKSAEEIGLIANYDEGDGSRYV